MFPVTVLLVRQAHSRFQLRRGTGFTTVLGGVMIALGAVGFCGAVASAPGQVTAMVCPALVGLALAFGGFRVMNAGALLLESQGSGAFVSSIDRQVGPPELKGVEVAWRFDSQREKEVEVRLELQGGFADVTQGWLPYADPEALGRQLSAVLGAPAQVTQREG